MPRKVLFVMALSVSASAFSVDANAEFLTIETGLQSSYDSNYRRTNANAPVETILVGTFKLGLNAQTGRKKAHLDYASQVNRNARFKQDNIGLQAINGALETEVSSNGRLGINARYGTDIVVRGSSGDYTDPSLPTATYETTQVGAFGGLQLYSIPAKISFNTSGAATRYFSEKLGSSTQKNYNFSLSADYAWTADLFYVAGFDLIMTGIDSGLVVSANRVFYTPTTGIRWAISAKSQANFSIGTQIENAPDRPFADDLRLSLNTSFVWKIKSYSSVSAALTHGSVNSMDPYVGEYTSTAFKASFLHRFTPRLTGTMMAGMSYDTRINKSSDFLRDYSLGFAYVINRISISSGINLGARTSGEEVFSYKNFVSMLRISYAFSI